MTAINILRLPDRIVMLTDGAGMNSDDVTLGAIAPKVFPMPHMNAALAVRGVKAAHTVLADYVGARAPSYDDLCKVLPLKLRDWWRPQAQIWEQKVGPKSSAWELFIAGWSETRGPHSFIIGSSGLNSECGIRPWDLVDLGDCCIAPDGSHLASKHRSGLLEDYSDLKAIALFEDRRRLPERVCNIGGFIQKTEIFCDRIETKIIHRWSDVLESKIAA